jgi:ATP-binding protein involved in chromosome partitioning
METRTHPPRQRKDDMSPTSGENGSDGHADTRAAAVLKALEKVIDPEIRRPITELEMVSDVEVSDSGSARVTILLTVAGCPLRGKITEDVTAATVAVPGISDAEVVLDVMSEDQRLALREKLRGPTKDIPFNRPDSMTRVFAVASGKGGVGKSSVTANLAAALAADGLTVGLLDADIYGHSSPRMLGITGERPTVVEKMILPPVAHGVRVVSTEMFKRDRGEPVVWRGPMLHRALEQFLTDVYWGDLDILLLDLPPGTGDIAISLAQLLPGAELLLVTTPQVAAAEVAERAGSLASQTNQRITGVLENMSWLPCPHCGEPIDVFGTGGGESVVNGLQRRLGSAVPLLGQIPLDPRLRTASDEGVPLVLSDPDADASQALVAAARRIGRRERSLAGMSLGLRPA